MKQMTLSETAQYLRGQDNYLIVTHRRPDGDTIGSASALCRGLRALGKRAAILHNPQFTPKYAAYLRELCTQLPTEGCIIIAVDIADTRIFPLGFSEAQRIALCIDHHGSNTGYSECGCVVPEAAACGEIILELLECMQAPVDKQLAEAIYLAISTDTGCFRYANTSENTLACAARCKHYGADIFSINRAMFLTKRMGRWKLESRLIDNISLSHGGKVGICTIEESWIQELGLCEDDLDDISGFARQVEGVEIGVMLRQLPNGNGRISVRTAPGIDASAICARLGGGGHVGAAGAEAPGGIPGAKKAIEAAIDACWKE